MKTSFIAVAAALGMLLPTLGAEQRIRIEFHIAGAPEGETGGGRTLLKRKEEPKAKAGAEFSLLATPGKAFKASDFREFIAPSKFAPLEIRGGLKVIHREDGSILLENAEAGNGRQSFPVSPVTPSAFKVSKVGWEIEGTPRVSQDGLVILEAEIRHHDARAATAHYGEGTGPLVAKGTNLFGKEVEVIVSENKAQMASTSVTSTPLIVRARPGVAYPIEVMLGDKRVAATVRCTLAAAKTSAN